MPDLAVSAIAERCTYTLQWAARRLSSPWRARRRRGRAHIGATRERSGESLAERERDLDREAQAGTRGRAADDARRHLVRTADRPRLEPPLQPAGARLRARRLGRAGAGSEAARRAGRRA